MHKIDKSKFNAEQLAAYEELMVIGKADVDPESAEEEMEEFLPPKKTEKAEVGTMEETKKSAPEAEATAALEAVQKELAEFKERVEKQEFVAKAKKYAALGKNEEELGETLYNLNKSNKANYDAFVGILDEHLALVEKSGLFGEIGKSAGNHTTGGSVDKIEAKAAELRKADPSLGYNASIAKAWETSPELLAEYDDEYKGR